MADNSQATVDTPSALYEAMKENWELVAALMGGTKAMRDAAETYLPREGGESDEGYNARLNRSFLFPAFQRTIQALVGKVFAEAVELNEGTPADLEAMCENIDMAGRSLSVFSRDVFEAALRDGITHLHVDYPKTPTSTAGAAALTLADERKLGARPYIRHILASDVIGWWSEIRNGTELLTEVRIKEKVRVKEGKWGEKTAERVRVLRPGTYEVFEKNEKEDWISIESGTTSMTDEIPFRSVYTGRTGFMIADPPLINLAWMNVAHWQSSSDQRNILRVARVPFLFGAGLPEGGLADPQTGKFTMGASRAVCVAEAGATLGYVEHSGNAIAAGRTDLQDLKEEMSTMGFELLVRKPGNETATARAIDSAEVNSALAAMAIELQHAMDECLALMQKWRGVKETGTCEVNTNYSVSSEDAAIGQLLLQARQAREISRTTFWAELQRRGVLGEEFDADAEDELLANDKADVPNEPPGGDGADGADDDGGVADNFRKLMEGAAGNA